MFQCRVPETFHRWYFGQQRQQITTYHARNYGGNRATAPEISKNMISRYVQQHVVTILLFHDNSATTSYNEFS